jgi:hypothetical protein
LEDGYNEQKNEKSEKIRTEETCVIVTPKRALISRDSFLLIASLIEKADCIYFTALGFSKSLGLLPAKSTV